MTAAADMIRPSRLYRLAACPGAATLEAWATDHLAEPSRAAADLGSACHAAVAAALGGPAYDAEEFGELDRYSAWCVRRCVEFAQALPMTPGTRRVEARLPMPWAADATGTADVLGVLDGGLGHNVAVICDWKFGYSDQGEAADNLQLLAYAVAAAKELGCASAMAYLVQPRLDESRQVTAASYDADALERGRAYVVGIAQSAMNPAAEVRAGTHCQYCRAATRCPALRRYVMNAMEAMELIGRPTDAAGLGELVRDARAAAAWADAVLDEAKIEMAAGTAYAGWRLQSSGSTHRINPQQALALAGEDQTRIRALLAAATFSHSALKGEPWLAPAIESQAKSPSIRAAKKE